MGEIDGRGLFLGKNRASKKLERGQDERRNGVAWRAWDGNGGRHRGHIYRPGEARMRAGRGGRPASFEDGQ